MGLRPTAWNEAVARMKAVRRYLDGEDRSAEAAAREAAELGMSRSMFYLLSRIYERERSRGPHSVPSGATEEAQRAAASRSREPSDRDAAAWKAAGFALPPKATSRSNRMPVIAGDPIDAFVDVEADFVIDRAFLYVDVELHGQVWNTELLGLIDKEGSCLIGHVLTFGPPDGQRIMDLIHAVPGGRTLAISGRDPEISRPQTFAAAKSRGIEIVVGNWNPCHALWTVTGPRIGGIRLLERPIPKPPHPVVDHRILERVVERLVAIERDRSSSCGSA